MKQPIIDRANPLPIYHQIMRDLERMIRETPLGSGELIPTEHELCARYGVSRMTVRQAVDVLVKQGLLVRQKGKGTYVGEGKLSQPLAALTSFTMDMRSRGLRPGSRVLACGETQADPKVCEKLGLAAGAPVLRLARVRLANGVPQAYECSHLLPAETQPLLHMDLTDQSLYHALCNECGLRLAAAREAIEVNTPSPEICRLLEIPSGTPAFFIERVTFDSAGRAVEYVESYYRTDRFKFEVELNLRDSGR